MPSSKRKARRRKDFSYNPQRLVSDVGKTAVGIVGIGAVTTLGMGVLGAIKR